MQAGNLASAFSSLINIHKSYREIIGVKPASETPEEFAELVRNASILTNIFGVGCEKQEVPEIETFIAGLPQEITSSRLWCTESGREACVDSAGKRQSGNAPERRKEWC